QQLGRPDEAIASYETAIRLKPDFADAYKAQASVLLGQRLYQEALAGYEKAFSLAPKLPYLCGERLHARFFVCHWEQAKEETAALLDMVGHGEKASVPFPILALSASRKHQLSAARTWVSDRCPPNNALPFPSIAAAKPDRLRVGYFSSDFRKHATAWLLAE